MTVGPARAVGEAFQPDLVVAREDFVAGLAGDAELPEENGHLLAAQKPSNELQSFVHGFTRFPGHLALPQKAQLCNPCLRNEMSPLSPEGQILHDTVRLGRRGLPEHCRIFAASWNVRTGASTRFQAREQLPLTCL